MKVGYIGVGTMGAPMVRNLLKHDHAVTVYDLSAQSMQAVQGAGAQTSTSCEAVAQSAAVVFTCLPMPADVEAALLGSQSVLGGAHGGLTVVDMSTNSPEVSKKLEAAFAEKGVDFMDAPVSGGLKGATNATLGIMCGGKKEVFERVKPLLECMGAHVIHAGEAVGSGNVAKLCNNMVSFCNLLTAVEGMLLARRCGVEPATMLNALRASSGNSNALGRIEKNGLTGDWTKEFSLDLAYKDLQLALQLGDQSKTPLSCGPNTMQWLRQAKVRNWGDLDLGVLIRMVEEAMQTSLRD